MSNIVFILGAGASKETGAPLMGDFLDMARDLYSSSPNLLYKDSFEKVFEVISKLQIVHSKSQLDLINIESVFSALEIAQLIGKLPGFNSDDIPDIIKSLKHLIIETLEKSIKYPKSTSGGLKAPEPYETFASLIRNLKYEATPRHHVSLITFNYDIALDFALMRETIDYSYYFSGSSNTGIPYLKLHGSLNWGMIEYANDSFRIDIAPITTSIFSNTFRNENYGYSRLSNYFLQTAKDSENVKTIEPFIIPPTINKTAHQKLISPVWHKAAEELGNAEFIIIIGYSLPETDTFFKLLFSLGTIGDHPLRKIIVIDPCESVKDKFESLLGPGSLMRYYFLNKKFSDSIDKLNKILKVNVPGSIIASTF